MNGRGDRQFRQHRRSVSRTAKIVCLLGLVGLIGMTGDGPITAQSGGVSQLRNATDETTARLAPVERQLPVQQVSRLLTPDWQSIQKTEYRRLLKAATPPPPGPPTTWIDRAEYFAVLTEESLSGGRVVYDVRHNASQPGFFLLDPISFALTELGWKDRRAIWGTITNGRLGVLAERRHERLSGNWSQAGRRLGRRIEFELQLPSATVSQLHLQTPFGWKLESTAGQITGPFPTSALGWFGWRVDLGSRTECRLIARQLEQSTASRPVTLVETNLTHVIRRDSLQFEAKLVVDVSQAATRSLTMRIPREVSINSVLYGAEIPLVFNVRRTGNHQKLRISFPDALLGKSRSITVHGVANARLGVNRVLPQIQPVSGSFLPGNVSVTVMAPLKLRSLSHSGLRQTSPLTVSSAGETLTFRQWRSDARIVVNVGESQTALSAKAVSHLDLSSENWQLESSIEWTARKGSTFDVKCRLLPGWKVNGVRVQSLTADGAEKIQTNWYLQRKKSGIRWLIVDLPDSLKQDRTILLSVTAERVPPLRFRQLRFPVLQPLNCDTLFHLLAVTRRGGSQPATRNMAGWRLLRKDQLKDVVPGSKLIESVLAMRERSPLFFLSESVSANGFLRLSANQPGIDARIWSIIHSDHSQLRENVTATVTPRGRPVGRVVIYFTANAEKTDWKFPSVGRNRISTRLLPLARHAEWGLPERGELWELRFTRPLTGKFQIVVNREVDFTAPAVVDLAFFPGVRSFVGTVELDSPGSAVRGTSSGGARPIEQIQRELSQRPTTATSDGRPGALWRYEELSDEILLLKSAGQPRPKSAPVATLELRSILTADGGDDIHIATYRINRSLSAGRFEFSLPQTVHISSVRLNGNGVKPFRDGRRFVIHGLAANREHVVEIRYRAAGTVALLRTSRSTTVPATPLSIVRFDWTFALPPHLQLSSAPSFGSLSRRLNRPVWTTRLFGPLGRPAHESMFNPFTLSSWQNLLSDESDFHHSPGGDSSARSFAPRGWNVYHFTAPTVVENPELTVWDPVEVRRISWVILLSCLTVGLLLRRWRIAPRRRIAAIWLSACVSTAWLVPAEYAEIVGACLAGTVIALLIPRWLVLKPNESSQDALQISLGSTASFRPSISSLPLLLSVAALMVFSDARAEKADSKPDRPPITRSRSDAKRPASGEQRLDPGTVVIPLDNRGGTIRPSSIFYMHKSLLARLKKQELQLRLDSPYVIRSANYQLRLDGRNSVRVEARLDVELLPSVTSADVNLPFRNVHLRGANACRVNGQVQPVRRSKQGTGYVVRLTVDDGNDRKSSGANNAGANNAGSNNAGSNNGNQKSAGQKSAGRKPRPQAAPPLLRRSFEIRFDFQVVVRGSEEAGSLEFGIPAVSAARFFLQFPQPFTVGTLPTSRGRVQNSGWFFTSISAEPGRTEILKVAWSSQAENKGNGPRIAATVLQRIRVEPEFLTYRLQVRYDVKQGRVEEVVWSLPRDAVIKSLEVSGVVGGIDSLRQISRDGRNSSMVIELAAAHEKPFALEAVLIQPRQNSAGKDSGQIDVPLLDILRESRGDKQSGTQPKESARQLVGISTSGEFELSLKTFAAKSLTPIAAKDLNPGTDHPFGLKPPAFAFRMTGPTTLAVHLKPRIPQRQVRQSQIGRIRRGRLEWKLTAQIETTSAPAFDHRISVDPRLRIQEITVSQDQAPRLVRWSRIGDKVILFLSDQATASQTVSITARMPISESGKTRLPAIRFLDADTKESNLSLYRDDDVGVEIAENGIWKVANFPAAQFLPDGGSRLLGTYSSDAPGPMPEIREELRSRRLYVDSVYHLHQQKEDHWSLTAVFRFSQSPSPAVPYRLHLPRELAENVHIQSETLRVASHRHADGSRDVTLSARQSSSSANMVRVTGTVHRPRQRQWRLPQIRIDGATLRENYLRFPADAGRFSVSLPAISRKLASFPRWTAGPSRKTDASMRGFFQRNSSDWSLTVRTSRDVSLKPFIALMETHTWQPSDEMENGRTAMLLLGRWKKPFAVRLPDDVAVRAIVVSGESFRPGSLSKNSLTIPIDRTRSEQTVVLHWTRSRTSPVWWPHRTTEQFPSPVGVDVKRSLASLVYLSKHRLFAADRFERRDSFQYRFERLEGLLQACRLVLQHENRRPALWENTQQIFRNVKRELADRRQNGDDVDSATSARFQQAEKRYLKLRRSLQRLPIPSGLVGAAPASGNLTFSLSMSRDDGSVIQGRFASVDQTPEELDATFWVVDARLISWLIALGLFLLILPILRRLIKGETGELLSLWEPVAWAVLGFIWWFCLTPGFVGLLLILAAGGRTVYLHFHPRNRKQSTPVVKADSVSAAH